MDVKFRIDAWQKSEDEYLVNTVLRYIREGKTQLLAFDDVGVKLERTPGACAFRWNKELRKDYEEEIKEARRDRLKIKKSDFVKSGGIANKLQPKDVSVLKTKEFEGHRVVTFKDIDEVHGRPEGTARKNFNANKHRFLYGTDYFVRNSDEALKEFDVVAPNGLRLITESGYLMLVKSFTDDIAWEVQRKLVNTYFRVKQSSSCVLSLPTSFAEALRLAADLEEEKQRLQSENLMLEQQVAEYEPKITYIDTILQSSDSVLVSQIAEDYGLSARELNKILHQEEVQYKMNDQWLLYSQHKGKGLTESKTHKYEKPNGEIGTKLHTRWTQKGRLFIHSVLEKQGITPTMDKELVAPTTSIK